MSYNLNNLSETALQKIFFVMEEIHLSSELHSLRSERRVYLRAPGMVDNLVDLLDAGGIDVLDDNRDVHL